MKKYIAIALWLSFGVISINAQEQKLKLGLTFSPQLSWMNSDNKTVDTDGALGGFKFGVILENYFAKNYAFASGLTINSTGGKLKYNDGVTIQDDYIYEPFETVEYRLQYIEIPIALKLKTNDIRRFVYWGQFGLTNQFNIGAKNNDKENISSSINFYDVSYHFGAGMEYNLGGSTNLLLGIIYNNGFVDVTHNHTIKDKAVLNRLTLQIGVLF